MQNKVLFTMAYMFLFQIVDKALNSPLRSHLPPPPPHLQPSTSSLFFKSLATVDIAKMIGIIKLL
jgi:hypothetical protein